MAIAKSGAGGSGFRVQGSEGKCVSAFWALERGLFICGNRGFALRRG